MNCLQFTFLVVPLTFSENVRISNPCGPMKEFHKIRTFVTHFLSKRRERKVYVPKTVRCDLLKKGNVQKSKNF